MNTVTLAITLPQNGTDLEYAEAVSMAISQHAGNGIAQMALSRLLATMQWPRPGAQPSPPLMVIQSTRRWGPFERMD